MYAFCILLCCLLCHYKTEEHISAFVFVLRYHSRMWWNKSILSKATMVYTHHYNLKKHINPQNVFKFFVRDDKNIGPTPHL